MKQTDLILGIISLLMTIIGLGLFIITRLVSRYYKNHPVTMMVADRAPLSSMPPLAATEIPDEPIFEPLATSDNTTIEETAPDCATVTETFAVQRIVAIPVESAPDAVAHEIRRVDDFRWI